MRSARSGAGPVGHASDDRRDRGGRCAAHGRIGRCGSGGRDVQGARRDRDAPGGSDGRREPGDRCRRDGRRDHASRCAGHCGRRGVRDQCGPGAGRGPRRSCGRGAVVARGAVLTGGTVVARGAVVAVAPCRAGRRGRGPTRRRGAVVRLCGGALPGASRLRSLPGPGRLRCIPGARRLRTLPGAGLLGPLRGCVGRRARSGSGRAGLRGVLSHGVPSFQGVSSSTRLKWPPKGQVRKRCSTRTAGRRQCMGYTRTTVAETRIRGQSLRSTCVRRIGRRPPNWCGVRPRPRGRGRGGG